MTHFNKTQDGSSIPTNLIDQYIQDQNDRQKNARVESLLHVSLILLAAAGLFLTLKSSVF